MGRVLARFREVYGAKPFHLLVGLGALALTGYIISVVGLAALWDGDVWWQTLLVWFLGAIVVHDFVLFPLYAVVDRSVSAAVQLLPSRRSSTGPRVSLLNYVRVPLLAAGLLFLLFFPGIIEQGSSSYVDATGQTQEPFLQRWLFLTAAIFALSAASYALRVGTSSRRPAGGDHAPAVERHDERTGPSGAGPSA